MITLRQIFVCAAAVACLEAQTEDSHVIVILRDQPQIRIVEQMRQSDVLPEDLGEMRRLVSSQARQEGLEQQQLLITSLQQRGARDIEAFQTVNAVSLAIRASTAEEIASEKDVLEVLAVTEAEARLLHKADREVATTGRENFDLTGAASSGEAVSRFLEMIGGPYVAGFTTMATSCPFWIIRGASQNAANLSDGTVQFNAAGGYGEFWVGSACGGAWYLSVQPYPSTFVCRSPCIMWAGDASMISTMYVKPNPQQNWGGVGSQAVYYYTAWNSVRKNRRCRIVISQGRGSVASLVVAQTNY